MRVNFASIARPRLLMVALGAFASGCHDSPPIVSAASSRDDDLKLVYTDPSTGEEGVLDCRVDANATVRDCRRLKLIFRD